LEQLLPLYLPLELRLESAHKKPAQKQSMKSMKLPSSDESAGNY